MAGGRAREWWGTDLCSCWKYFITIITDCVPSCARICHKECATVSSLHWRARMEHNIHITFPSTQWWGEEMPGKWCHSHAIWCLKSSRNLHKPVFWESRVNGDYWQTSDTFIRTVSYVNWYGCALSNYSHWTETDSKWPSVSSISSRITLRLCVVKFCT